MEFGLPSSSNQAFITNLPIFETFHQSPNGDFRTSFYNPFEVKHRKRTTKGQFKVLEKAFYGNPKPNNAVRRTLAQELGMTPRGVQVWFQNRRAKAKNLKSQKGLDDGMSAETENDLSFGDENSSSDSEEKSQSFESDDPQSTTPTSSSSLSGVVSKEASKKASKYNREAYESSGKKQRPNPQSLKIAETPEQYEKMLRQHQSQRDDLEPLPQQRKRSLESQLYYHQNEYPYGIASADDKYMEFRSRANSLPGPKSGWENFGPMSATESNFPTDLLSPMSSYISSNMSAPMSAVSLPDHLHDYVSTYSPSINSLADDLSNQNDLINSHPISLATPTSLSNNPRRNSCPPEFVASYVSMGFVPAEKQHLATIAEDDQFFHEHSHLTNQPQHHSFFDTHQSSAGLPCFTLDDSLEVPFAKSIYSQQLSHSPSYSNLSSHMGDYGKLKMRRLSEPRISKSCNSVSLTNEEILLSHQDIHHNPLLLDTHSIPQYNSIGPGTLLRGHSMDSTNWDLSAKISNNYGNYVGKSQHTSNHMNFSTSFSMNSIQVSQAGIPLDGSMSSVSSTPIPYMDDMSYSIYASGENFS